MLEKIQLRKGHYSATLLKYDYGSVVRKCLQYHNENTGSAKSQDCSTVLLLYSLLITSIGNSFVRVGLFQINFQGFNRKKINIRYKAILKLRYDLALNSMVTSLEMPHC